MPGRRHSVRPVFVPPTLRPPTGSTPVPRVRRTDLREIAPPPFNVVRAVNHILTAKHGKRIAIIENEFGEVGVDDGLVVETKEEIFEMNNGCICCTVRQDLIRILNKLMRRKDAFDHIIIETTGLADPAPVAQTFFVDEDLKEKTVPRRHPHRRRRRASIRPTWTKSSRTGWRTNRWSRSHSPIKSY